MEATVDSVALVRQVDAVVEGAIQTVSNKVKWVRHRHLEGRLLLQCSDGAMVAGSPTKVVLGCQERMAVFPSYDKAGARRSLSGVTQ